MHRFFNRCLLFANFTFILGVTITTILISKTKDIYEFTNRFLIIYAPFIFLAVIGIIFASVFVLYKRSYFTLVYLHLRKKTHILYYASILLFAFNFFLITTMMFIGTELVSFSFVRNGYFYLILAFAFLLSLIDISLGLFSNIYTKIDLATKRL